MRAQLSQGQGRTARAVLLLTIDWAGQIYRFSSEAVAITDGDGAILNYGGGLSIDQIAEQLDRATISADDLAVPVELLFPVDVVARVRAGAPLSMASAELAVVMVRGRAGSATVIQQFEDRSVLLRGSVSEPIIGEPGTPNSRVVFSVVSQPADDQRPLLDGRTRISNTRITSSNNKLVPFVFGRPGVYVDADGNEQIVPGSPAYEGTGKDGTFANLRQAVLTTGKATATEITLIDDTGKETVVDTSYLTGAGGWRTIAEELLGETSWDDPPVWVAWSEATVSPNPPRGALANPYGAGFLTGAGDVIRHVFAAAGSAIDHGAWAAAAQHLNRYRFAGYVNEAETTVWTWLAQHILPMIPGLSVVRGVDGLVPILYGTNRAIGALPSVTTGPGFALVSGESEERPPSDVINDVTLEYAFDAKEEKAKRALRVGPAGVIGVDLVSPVATSSSRIYGHRIGPTISSRYIYEDATARSILTDWVARRAFIGSEITIAASPEYIWLDLGNEIALTSTDLLLTARRAVVIGRSWAVLSGEWVFTLWLSPDPLGDPPEL